MIALPLVGGTVAQADEPSADPELLVALDEAQSDAAVQLGDYWLGVAVEPVTPAMRSQLGLPDEQGLMVENVQPNSPAAKAGIQNYDVLVKGNDKPLKHPRELVQLINQVKEGKLTVDLVRGGKHQTMSVTPAKRPAGQMGQIEEFTIPNYANAQAIQDWIKKLESKAGEGGPLEFHIVGPGQILPHGAPLPPGVSANMNVTVTTQVTLPDGYKVTVVRDGGKPAAVTVTREKEKWEGTEKDLSKIPEKIRPEVEKMIHSGAGGNVFFHAIPGQRLPGPGVLNIPPVGPSALQPGTNPRIEKRLSDMNRQIEELRKSLDDLRGKAPPAPAPEKKP